MLHAPFMLGEQEVSVTASIGITMYPMDASTPAELIKYADTAMYRAKQAGRDTFQFFTAQMNLEVLAKQELEQALRKAYENGEFVLHYQPKIQLSTGRVCGLEALLRWERPGYGLVSPKTFIGSLEETGLIVQVGSWVIATACRQIGLWLRSSLGPTQISVNVAGRQFAEGDLDADVIAALEHNGVPPELLELELTESSLMANTERTISTLKNLKRRGVQISIDDFGTGYSSLAYLRRFPIDKLKIDIAFIREVTSNPDDAAIVLAILGMAHSLKMEVIAEGVETAAQLAFLKRNHCDQVQGFFFSKPLALPALEPLLLNSRQMPLPEPVFSAPHKTLLLVGHEAHVLSSLRRLLRHDGYRILSAGSAEEGFELLAQHCVQVIVCDQCMPNMSGTQFFDRVKVMYPDSFRIVLSGYTDHSSIIRAVNQGAIYRFYTKPWDNTVLRNDLREAFRHYSLLHDVELCNSNRIDRVAQRASAS
jgi:EAL domain-containing protein (putative c-di-GMP-specific phosphodiesterase class I)/FixJ family two-component response regulator